MADISLNYILTGVDKSASKTMEATATAGQKAGQAIGKSFSGLGQQIGGEVGGLLIRVGDGIDQLATRGLSANQKLGVLGTGVAGLGVALMAFGSASKAADDQLKAAFDAAGYSLDDYKDKLDAAIESNYRFGHDDDATKIALRTLTTALGDPTKAFERMGLVADYAAARNISLQESADVLAKALSGGSTRALTAYGIQIETNADGTKNLEKAADDLAAKLDGQASAAANNFTGWLRSMWAQGVDLAEDFANTVGPGITIVGGALTGVSAIMQIYAAVQNARAAATARAAAAEAASIAPTSAAAAALSAETQALIANEGAKNANAAAGRGMTGAMFGFAGVLGTVGAAAAATAQLDSWLNTGISTLAANMSGNAVVSAEQFTKGLRDGTLTAKTLAASVKDVSNDTLRFYNSTMFADEGTRRLFQSAENLDKALAGLPLDELKTQYEALTAEAIKNGQTQDDVAKAYPNAAAIYKSAVDSQTDATEDLGDSADETKQELEELANEIRNTASEAFKARDAARDYEQAIDDLATKIQAQKDAYLEANGTLDGFTLSLDIGTQAGRDNQAALDAIAQAALNNAAAIQQNTGSQTDANAAILTGRDNLIAALEQFGITGQAAEDYATKLGLVPKEIPTSVTVRGVDAAIAELDRLFTGNRNVGVEVVPLWERAGGGTIGRAGGGSILALAGAGTVTGGGTPTSDTATRRPVMLSIGEEVTRTYAASYPGVRPVLKAFNADPAGTMQQLSSMAAAASAPSTVVVERGSGLTGPIGIDSASIRAIAQELAREIRTGLRDGGTVNH